MEEDEVRTHMHVLGVLYILGAALVGVALFMVTQIMDLAESFGGGGPTEVAFVIFFALLFWMMAQAFTGFAVYQGHSWGKPMGIVFASLSLLSFPFGTAFGIYALVMLTHHDARFWFQR